MSGYTLNPAVACYSSGKSVVIDNPSAASSPSLSAHLCSPSVTLLFSPTASCNAALKQRCQVYKYNKVCWRRDEEEIQGRHNLCILILFWGGSQARLGYGSMCFQLLGLSVGTCMQIYMHDDECG